MPPLDRTPVVLHRLPPVDQLDHLAVWLNDCDTHVGLRRPGGLPCPPFGLFDAFVAVLEARDTRRRIDAVVGALAGQLTTLGQPPQSMAVLAHQEWFERPPRKEGLSC